MKPSTFFSRGDYRATQVLLVLTAVAVPASTLVPPLLSWVRGGPLEVAGAAPGDAPGPVVAGSTPSLAGRYEPSVVWSLADPGVAQRLVALVPAVLVSLVVVLAAGVLWRLVATTRRGEPFDRRAVRQLRLLGVLVLGYAVVATFAPPLVLLAVLWSEPAPGLALSLDLSTLFPFVVGFCVLVLAEGFRVGLRLRDDVEGLV